MLLLEQPLGCVLRGQSNPGSNNLASSNFTICGCAWHWVCNFVTMAVTAWSQQMQASCFLIEACSTTLTAAFVLQQNQQNHCEFNLFCSLCRLAVWPVAIARANRMGPVHS